MMISHPRQVKNMMPVMSWKLVRTHVFSNRQVKR
jgi:hypothetical protein